MQMKRLNEFQTVRYFVMPFYNVTNPSHSNQRIFRKSCAIQISEGLQTRHYKRIHLFSLIRIERARRHSFRFFGLVVSLNLNLCGMQNYTRIRCNRVYALPNNCFNLSLKAERLTYGKQGPILAYQSPTMSESLITTSGCLHKSENQAAKIAF